MSKKSINKFTNQEKGYTLNKKSITELDYFLKKLIQNFWNEDNEDLKILNKKEKTEDFLIENFKVILRRRAENWENWIIFLIKEIKKNKKVFTILEIEIKKAEEKLIEINNTKKIYDEIWITYFQFTQTLATEAA